MKIKGIEKGFFYHLPTKVFFGRGVLKLLIDLDEVKKAKKILLFIGSKSLEKSGIKRKVVKWLENEKKEVKVYSGIIKSDIDTLNKAIEFCRAFKPDVVIGIGGGAVLDTAKISACLYTNSDKIEDYVVTKKKIVKESALPLIAAPTTAGTGSEVSPFAVIWGSKQPKKHSFYSEHLYPKIALVDPELCLTLLAYQTACAGMDALAQAIEAYWAKNHNPISDLFALEVIQLVLANLEKTVKNRDNVNLREKMVKAALLAGFAFSNTKTTICHAVSYPITARFNIPHGHAVALTLASFLEFSFEAIEKNRGTRLLKAMSVKSVEQGCAKIVNLMKAIGMETHLSKLGIKEEDIKIIVAEGFSPERASNAPKIPTKQELKEILMKIF